MASPVAGSPKIIRDLHQRLGKLLEEADTVGLAVRAFTGGNVNYKNLTISCRECGSTEIEEWGESGIFWLHCHGCHRDGPDLPDMKGV